MTEEPKSPPRRWGGTSMLVVALLLAVAAVVRVTDSPDPEPEPTAAPAPTATSSTEAPPTLAGPRPPEVDPALMLGSDTAPVTMVVFGDYQCPHCATFATEQQPLLRRDHIDTGRLRLIWRDYPYLGEESTRAAVAARAAARQDAYWDYHAALYADPDAWRVEGASTESLVRVAAEVGLDTGRFRADLDDPRLRAAVRADFDFALGLGVPGTPAFLVNGRAFFGAQPIDVFEERITDALRQTDD